MSNGSMRQHETGSAIRPADDSCVDRHAFVLITIPQVGMRGFGYDQAQFPGEIEGILDPCVHALCAHGTVNMRRIACKENPALSEVVRLSIGTTKGACRLRLCRSTMIQRA